MVLFPDSPAPSRSSFISGFLFKSCTKYTVRKLKSNLVMFLFGFMFALDICALNAAHLKYNYITFNTCNMNKRYKMYEVNQKQISRSPENK